MSLLTCCSCLCAALNSLEEEWDVNIINVLLWQSFLSSQQCAGSICERFELEECTCASTDAKDDKELCHVCCMEKSKWHSVF